MAGIVSWKTLWAVITLVLFRIKFSMIGTLHTILSIPQRKIGRTLSTSLLINQKVCTWRATFTSSSRWIPEQRRLASLASPINKVRFVIWTWALFERDVINQGSRTRIAFSCWRVPITGISARQTSVTIHIWGVSGANTSEDSLIKVRSWRTGHTYMSISKVECSSWALNTLISVPDRRAVRTPCALVAVNVPVLILLARGYASFWNRVPCSWILACNTSAILDVWRVGWADTFQDAHIKDESSGAWETLSRWDIEMSSNWTTNAMSSIPDWSVNWACKTFINCAVVISVRWTWNASICCEVPMTWRITWDASSAWKVWESIRAFALENFRIESQPRWTWEASLCSWIVVLICRTANTNRPIPNRLACWTLCTRFNLVIIMSIHWTLVTRLRVSVPISWPITNNTDTVFGEVRRGLRTDAS